MENLTADYQDRIHATSSLDALQVCVRVCGYSVAIARTVQLHTLVQLRTQQPNQVHQAGLTPPRSCATKGDIAVNVPAHPAWLATLRADIAPEMLQRAACAAGALHAISYSCAECADPTLPLLRCAGHSI